jgi:hypothetical protein
VFERPTKSFLSGPPPNRGISTVGVYSYFSEVDIVGNDLASQVLPVLNYRGKLPNHDDGVWPKTLPLKLYPLPR